MAIAVLKSGGPWPGLIVLRGREREGFERLTEEFAAVRASA